MGYKRYKPVLVVINGKEVEMLNNYGCYSAEYVHMTGKPHKKENRQSNWYSATQCKKMKRPVLENEQPVAFQRAVNGYYSLYERN